VGCDRKSAYGHNLEAGVEPKRRTLDLPWGTVSYLEWDGRSRGKTLDVLLLHGGGLDSARLSWGALGDALSEAGHRVIAPDHPGYGRSRPPPWPAAQDRLVSYVGEFADGLGLPEEERDESARRAHQDLPAALGRPGGGVAGHVRAGADRHRGHGLRGRVPARADARLERPAPREGRGRLPGAHPHRRPGQPSRPAAGPGREVRARHRIALPA